MARPTDYSPEILEKARAYRDNPLPEDEVVHSIEGLALAAGIARSTIYEWEGTKGKEDFSDIVSEIRERQAKSLITGGLTGKFNSKIASVMMSKHGYAERSELTGKDGEPLFDDKEAKEKGKAAITDYLGDTGKGD